MKRDASPKEERGRTRPEGRLTLSLPVAVAITVVVALPFGLWLGPWTIPLFPAFIVWTEYFVLGSSPQALKTIAPAYIAGVIAGTAALILSLLLDGWLDGASLIAAGDVAWIAGLFLAFIPLIWVMRFLPFTQGQGGLPYFNGITMGMATYFVGGYEEYGRLSMPDHAQPLVPLITMLPAVFAGVLGMFLGWFNIAIMTPLGRGGSDGPAKL
ncbi:DUF1097 domain-containing protein [Burkholderia contaminans]|jgi:hypothetical protein|uniref:DUF1097 domain-containing protein n=1 Tax=Burkholderia contaminans TaxID=488447 RepID=A0ABD7XWN4_9BURK|nr:DUF1097 domain-containing protein [Burkholderia contaminans]MBH9690971.1 DUF1097 domain-containing protein [Burkholderia contaminans]MBY4823358.1 DUF1097 domain-containing protein [Burkholderia contaminans]MBY4853648.1 DUF1097 domain-containing protein [Burkholderia contaminans]MBY4879963.1 DUF1097 domain-containing protein [Burkholderia contaminans]MCA7910904.1 DUF1097 domain-containing protein [Burkholderia contaminans]